MGRQLSARNGLPPGSLADTSGRRVLGLALRLAGLAAGLAGLLVLAAPATAQQGMPGAGEPPPLQVGRQAVTILEIDEASHTVGVLERYELRNPSDAPFVPSTTGSQGPMGLLRFGLPRDAFDLTLDPQLAAHDIVQVDRGFASFMPVPPGQTDVTFTYRLPYARDSLDLPTVAVYPTAALWVLVPADLAVSSGGLEQREVVNIGRQRYQVLVAQDLAAGQRLTVSLSGLPFTPRPWLLDETVQRVAAAVLTLIGVLAAWAYARWRGAGLTAEAAR